MVSMLIFGFLQVFARFILKSPIGWSEELLTYSFTWASFIGASMANLYQLTLFGRSGNEKTAGSGGTLDPDFYMDPDLRVFPVYSHHGLALNAA